MAKASNEVPRSIQNKPELSMYESWVFNSYLQLNGSRNFTSVGPAFIPYDIVICWLNENRIFIREEREEIIYYFGSLDSAYLDHIEAKRPK